MHRVCKTSQTGCFSVVVVGVVVDVNVVVEGVEIVSTEVMISLSVVSTLLVDDSMPLLFVLFELKVDSSMMVLYVEFKYVLLDCVSKSTFEVVWFVSRLATDCAVD